MFTPIAGHYEKFGASGAACRKGTLNFGLFGPKTRNIWSLSAFIIPKTRDISFPQMRNISLFCAKNMKHFLVATPWWVRLAFAKTPVERCLLMGLEDAWLSFTYKTHPWNAVRWMAKCYMSNAFCCILIRMKLLLLHTDVSWNNEEQCLPLGTHTYIVEIRSCNLSDACEHDVSVLCGGIVVAKWCPVHNGCTKWSWPC